MKVYTVELTEKAEIDLDRIYLRYNRISPDQADRWRAGFTKSAASLSSLPNRCPIVRDSDRFQGITVRQLLFGNYRILFHVIELAEEETEGVVRVMRVLHSAQMLDSGEQIEDD